MDTKRGKFRSDWLSLIRALPAPVAPTDSPAVCAILERTGFCTMRAWIVQCRIITRSHPVHASQNAFLTPIPLSPCENVSF